MKVTTEKALQPSIVHAFSIHGLYGFRTLHLNSPNSASILIAKNGAGKTTLLAALNVFLKRQFHRLLEVDFERIVCTVSGTTVVLHKSELDQVRGLLASQPLTQLVEMTKLPPPDLLDLISTGYTEAPIHTLQSSEFLRHIQHAFRYDMQAAKVAFDRLCKEYETTAPSAWQTRATVASCIRGYEIVYLPTYRRVELPLAARKSDESSWGPPRLSPARSLEVFQGGLHAPEINFGLADISERLSRLNSQIQAKSNDGYRKISANIIKEALDGSFDKTLENPGALPDRAALKLFFDRIRAPNSSGMHLMMPSDVVIPAIDQIYGEGANTQMGRLFLPYFLTKLGQVIESTRDVEIMVEQFVEHCNAYLSGPPTEIETWEPRGAAFYFDPDAKSLILDRQNLDVHVVRAATQQKVPLDALSSGEKQIISLFARLYLYQAKMIVLIDEPELSLSIEWQQKILPDVLSAPNCTQLIAITHSPFVFENELDPFAGPLLVESNYHYAPETDNGDLFDA